MTLQPFALCKELNEWLKDQRELGGRIIVPVLMIDEVAAFEEEHLADRLIGNLKSLTESVSPVVVRLTGTWSDTPTFVYNRGPKTSLDHHKVIS